MSRSEVQRGKNFEYRVVNLARNLGLPSRRILLSGATPEKGDVEIAGLRFECKYRKLGLATVHEWVNKAVSQGLSGVILGGHRSEPLVILTFTDFCRMMQCIHEGERGEEGHEVSS